MRPRRRRLRARAAPVARGRRTSTWTPRSCASSGPTPASPTARPATPARSSGGLPNVTLPCLGGGPDVNLATLGGPRLINLWAVWCAPCREELPVFQEFQEKHGDVVPTLGIDYNDTQPKQALELARETGVTYPLLADPQAQLDFKTPFPSLRGLPFTAVVDASGEVVFREFVVIESLRQLEDIVEESLGVTL